MRTLGRSRARVYKIYDHDSDYVSILCRTMGDPAVLFGTPVYTSVRANHFMAILTNQYNRTWTCVRERVCTYAAVLRRICGSLISRESGGRCRIAPIASNVVFSIIYNLQWCYKWYMALKWYFLDCRLQIMNCYLMKIWTIFIDATSYKK